MGAYGHSRLYRMMLDSVTEQVMRAAKWPFLLSRK
jgi:nucleotide-binding universal stress UspA family protein